MVPVDILNSNDVREHRTYAEWIVDWVYSDHELIGGIRRGGEQMEAGQGRQWTDIKRDLRIG